MWILATYNLWALKVKTIILDDLSGWRKEKQSLRDYLLHQILALETIHSLSFLRMADKTMVEHFMEEVWNIHENWMVLLMQGIRCIFTRN